MIVWLTVIADMGRMGVADVYHRPRDALGAAAMISLRVGLKCVLSLEWEGL